jgi:ribosomal protein S18 acetylase RimI-like enzyme
MEIFRVFESKTINAKDISQVNETVLPVVYTPKEYIQMILLPDHFVYHVQSDPEQKVIGYIVARLEKHENNTIKGHILSISVLKEYQGRGIGKLLVGRLTTELKTKNIKTVTLNVMKSNTNAVGFYRHIGFTKYKKLVKYYSGNKDGLQLIQALS